MFRDKRGYKKVKRGDFVPCFHGQAQELKRRLESGNCRETDGAR